MAQFKHISVLINECIAGLNIKPGGLYFDGTLGGGGHSERILKESSPNGKLVATDLDIQAINAANLRLKEYSNRYTLINDNFKNFKNITCNMPRFDGILLDLGVSSYQLDNKERGFSYMSENAALDMRMDTNQTLTAADIVNNYPPAALIEVLKKYGEENFAANIVKNIVAARSIEKIQTTGMLNKIIDKSIPAKFKKNGHPSKQTYQALRIETNKELAGLYDSIIDMASMLKPGGRIAVITFHSLEDRIIKQAFAYLNLSCTCPPQFPICVCDKKQELKLINKKPITATIDELEQNSRSKSAKLRIAQKV